MNSLISEGCVLDQRIRVIRLSLDGKLVLRAS